LLCTGPLPRPGLASCPRQKIFIWRITRSLDPPRKSPTPTYPTPFQLLERCLFPLAPVVLFIQPESVPTLSDRDHPFSPTSKQTLPGSDFPFHPFPRFLLPPRQAVVFSPPLLEAADPFDTRLCRRSESFLRCAPGKPIFLHQLFSLISCRVPTCALSWNASSRSSSPNMTTPTRCHAKFLRAALLLHAF